MRNASATFQRMMHQVLSGVSNCEVYLDDIVIHSDDWVQHLETLREVCCRLRTASLTLNLAKCEFAKEQTPVLSAPDFTRTFKLQVDASDNGAGAVLLQEDQAYVEHPVSYFSRKFIGAQRNYSVIEKEALALLLAF